jgi:hypothetical protein
MEEKINEILLKNADELINNPDREIMALSLGKNEKHADNYQMAMTIKLRRSLERLNKEIEKAEKSTNRNFWIELILTIILGLATIFIGIVPLIKTLV